MTKFKVILSSLIFALLLSSCQQEKQDTEVEFRVPVTVETVGVDNIEELIRTTGTIRPPEIIKLSIKAKGLLKISERDGHRLSEGDHVNAGELIASITGEDVRLASQMEVVEQKLKEAKKNLEGTSVLFEKKLVSESVLEQVKTSYEQAKLEYDISIHSENQNRISSPIDGIILSLGRDENQLMANGQLVSPGQVIAEVASLNSVIADVNLVGKDIAKVRAGLEARAAFYAWKDKVFYGKVLRLSPTIDELTRSLQAEVEIKNNDLILKPGMFLEVSIIAQKRQGVTVIPRRSITQRGGRRVVFVINGQRAEVRPVEIGLGNEQQVEVLSGLKAGEKIVVLGMETLADQMPVRIKGQ